MTGGDKGLQGVKKAYRGLQEVTGGYKGLQGVRRGDKGLQRVRTFPDTFSSSILDKNQS